MKFKTSLLISILLLTVTLGAAQQASLKTLLYEKYDFVPDREKPVINVIRSEKEYKKLQKTHSTLPKADTIDFEKNAIVAVQATMPDPCHFLQFEQTGNTVRVIQAAYPDTICIQVLSDIIAVELVPVTPGEKLNVEFVTENSR